jgi:hypothetical protein
MAFRDNKIPQDSACGKFYVNDGSGFETEQPVKEGTVAFDRNTHIFS